MNNRLTAKIKSIFINITLLWSCAMAVLYIAVLFNTPVFSLLSLLPLGEWICEFLAMVLLFGIWAVPVLWLISLIFIIFTRIKLKEKKIKTKKNHRINNHFTCTSCCFYAVNRFP